MNIETEKTMSCMESIIAQSILMNGRSQFSPEETSNAELTLEKLVAIERSQGNHRLEAIYQNALNQVRRGY